MVAKLEVTVIENQQLTWQLSQAEKHFDQTIATKLKEIKRNRVENAQLMAQMEHFRTESMRLQRQLQIAEDTCEGRKLELFQKLEETARSQASLEDEIQMAAAMNISLNEQLESVTQDRNSKQEKLETLANDKSLVDDQLTHERNHTARLAQDLVAKELELSDRNATELQDARQRLEVSLADTERLHDEEHNLRMSIQVTDHAICVAACGHD